MEHIEKLRQFITGELLPETNTLADDEELLLSGLLDSMAIAQLVVFIEDELHVAVPAEDLRIENFSTLASIVGYLAR